MGIDSRPEFEKVANRATVVHSWASALDGKFTNGQVGVARCFGFEKTCRREAGTNSRDRIRSHVADEGGVR